MEHSIYRQEQTQRYLGRLRERLRVASSLDLECQVCSRQQNRLYNLYCAIEDMIKGYAPVIKKGQRPSCVSHDRW